MKRPKRETGKSKLETGKPKSENRKSEGGTTERRNRKQTRPVGPGLAPAKADLKNRKSAIDNRKWRTLPLLLEVGCEEIPARFLSGAQQQFGERVQAALAEARLLPAGADRGPPLHCYSTPRRLVLHAPAILERQPDKVEEVLGPSLKVAFDPAGKPTRAAQSFAGKQGVALKDLKRVTTPRGDYLAVTRTTRGRPALELLPALLPQAILGMSFPKSLYCVGISGPRFVRPIRWLLACLGEGKQAKVIPFEIAGVKSDDATYGHRAYARGPLRVRSFKEYSSRLRQAYVEFDKEARLKTLRNEAEVLLGAYLRRVEDRSLEEWLASSTEWPSAIRGAFQERYLHLPREILITVMRDHQKYFAVEDREGNLQPLFLAILNMDSDPRGLIRRGHERVLSARFSDAEFFWNADQRLLLSQRAELLARVTYEAELGSYAAKVRRMRTIASRLCATLEAYPVPFLPCESIVRDNAPKRAVAEKLRFTPLHTERVLRAVELCKCDLTTQMVQEFPELQGIVGGLYARAQGEAPEVADAIYDHYRPAGAEDTCPCSVVGAVVSLADKLDSVAGGFALGHEPTGSSDPFALRRQGNAIIKVLLEVNLPLSLKEAAQLALQALDIAWQVPQMEVFGRLVEFFEERLRYGLESLRRFRYDTVRAVLAAGWDVPGDALARAEALEALRGSADLEAVCVAAKRIKNILTKSATAQDWKPGEVDSALLEEAAERELVEAYRGVAEAAASLRNAGEYRRALERISSLRPGVDRFFDKVLVMAEDRGLRQNRLRLLGNLDELFSGIASFAEIASETRG
jgi:glycyl-tRNA synthetase beta chain